MAQKKNDNKDLLAYTSIDDTLRKKIIAELQKSYNMELETVMNYLANAIFLDGMLAKEVKESLDADVTEELGHARQLAMRIKILGGDIPGSQGLKMEQGSLQPPKNTTDVISVIKGVIEAETGAIEQYQKIIEMTGDDTDPVTQDLCVELKGDEEEHRREFVGFLREYDTLKEMLK
ncbi:ferritin-like domain-containing protein [Phycisphaerales bacterium AB-hyl4]|uniref:Ferritin-like domain-containing protein n=1 Tax=Natronomicrosphaera hydrolytica TaxID=3242702 RepID=A0ABV4UA70_9BACT